MGGIITLTTDFGIKDHYTGAMKGAVLSVNPSASLVDISHSITAGDIFHGAFVMAGACGVFPVGAVHVGVVDPGVGGPRRAVIVETENFLFVGPDNGLLSLAAQSDGMKRVIEIKNEKFLRPHISRTFHGRDIFGPVAGHLSLGVSLCEFGPEIKDLLMINIPEPLTEEGVIVGEVIHIDTYGNIITNIKAGLLESHLHTSDVEVRLKGSAVKGLYDSYASISPGEPGALAGGSGWIEVAAHEADGAELFGVGLGEKVRVVKR